MLLIDRYITKRLAANFVVLFLLLFVFAAGIDLILNLDEFVKVARRSAGDDASGMTRFATLLRLMLDFQAPRLFLFYAHLHGFVAIGAMGFTLAQMHRHRELVAMLASGVSLHRLAMPFVAVTFVLSLVQLANQEFMLHRVAPRLLRGHGEIGRRSVDEFEVRFIEDAAGRLLQAPAFNPVTETLRSPTVLVRDEGGRTTQRITADRATWDAAGGGWQLDGGAAVTLSEGPGGPSSAREPAAFLVTDLGPPALTVRRYGEYASMLSWRQIDEVLRTPRLANTEALIRHKYARIAAIGINVLVLFIALPAFLLREPVSLMRQTLICSALTIPAMTGAAIGMMVTLPGISPAVGVFLPVIVLIPIAVARWTFLRT